MGTIVSSANGLKVVPAAATPFPYYADKPLPPPRGQTKVEEEA